MRWLRRLIRKNMKPVHEMDAIKWKQRLALIYAFAAWNTFGIVIYYMYTGKSDWAHYYGLELDEEKEKRPAIYWAEVLGREKATIYRVKNFQVEDKTEYDATSEKKH